MKVEIWSDIVCPWCYIGKRRFEAALAQFVHRDQVEIIWHSFELDPDTPQSSDETLVEMLMNKYGTSRQQALGQLKQVTDLAAKEGLAYQLEAGKPANTFNAHRLIHLAAKHNLQEAMKERLLRAHLVENLPVNDKETLVQLATEVGIESEEAQKMLADDTYTDDVVADKQRARMFGITGVPFFAIDEKYGISGAQPTEVFLKALEQAWADAHPLINVTAGSQQGGVCEGDNCAL